MTGYTPLFHSITTGTLCGKWPDIGLWPIILSLSDRYGVVDVTHQYLATITGLPVDDVVACMDRFCQPDKASRSNTESGARLVLIEEHRDWGWKIVNHSKYAEKARLIHKNARAVESGKEAERKRTVRAKDKCPPESAGVHRCPTPQSQSQSQSQSKKSRARATRIPDDFELTDERRIVAEAETLSAERTFAKFVDYWSAASGARARKHDWDATWRNWCRNEADRFGGSNGATSRKTKFEEFYGADDAA